MENGVAVVNGDDRALKFESTDLVEESKGSVRDSEGNLKLESTDNGLNGLEEDSVEESKGSVRGSEENDEFEEAELDRESFYTPAYRHMGSDSQDLQEADFDSVESADGVDGEDGDNQDREAKEVVDSSNVEELGSGNKEEVFDTKLNGVEVDRVTRVAEDQEEKEMVDDLCAVEQEEVIPDKTDVQVSDQSGEDREGVGSGEEEEVFVTKLNGLEGDDVVKEGSFGSKDVGEKGFENGDKELTEDKLDNGECNGTVSDEGHNVLHEILENGLSLVASSDEICVGTASKSKEQAPADEICVEAVTQSEEQTHVDERGVDTGTKSKEQTHVDEMGVDTDVKFKEELPNESVKHMVNDSVELDSTYDDQTTYMQREAVHSPSPLSVTANGITTRSYASVVKESTPDGKLEQAKEDGSSCDSKSEVKENSIKDDDDKKSMSKASSSTAPVLPEGSGGPSLPSRPAGLGTSAPLLEPGPRALQQPRANGVAPQRRSQASEEPANDDPEDNDETHEKLQKIRVKFLRLTHRLGQTPHNVVVAQVLYRLGLAEQLRRNTNRPGVFSFDRASVMAEQLESSGREPLDFSCTIMVIGKTGAGKSATINSVLDEVKLHTDAFQSATKKVQEIVGTVQGIKVRIIDTPGLYPSFSDQWRNEKILHSVKRFISKSPPDIVLYFDRMDMQSRDYGDVPLLRSITDVFGSSIWFNAIIVLTHAASAPPDGPNNTPMSYEMFVTQRSHVVQQAIRQAAQDLRLMNPVSLVENHSACRMNRAGQRVLPNGQVWKPHLLLLSFASKILAEANTLLQLQDAPAGRPFAARSRAPPLPFFLSSLLQSRPQLKLPEEQLGDSFNEEEGLDEASDSDDGSDDYDELPPFRTLNKSQLAKLSRAQQKAYFEELDYREKLFFRKQLKEEKRRRKLMKNMAEATKDLPVDQNENVEEENNGPASVPVPMPDLVLPTSFDSDNPTHRYRFLDTSNQWIVRPVLENHVWDHDVGYDGLNVERLLVIKDKIPVSVSGQLTKDKKDCTFQMELASSIKHSDAGATSLGLDMQTVGKDMAYTFRGESRIKNFRRNNTAVGGSVTVLGDSVSAGAKIEDNLVVNKRLKLLMSGGVMAGRGDVAYGGRLEGTLRDKDYPIGRALSTLALSVVDWHGDLAIGCNVQSQIPLGRGTNVVAHANLNNKGTGQVGIRLNSSEQLQIALVALVPLFRHVKRVLFGSSQTFD
ncbi:uncharacterized protein A4U43_C10F16620 [Asparagus officinalis]|uniref:AIG1-type G domain-containing protein n=1 Tax=Asparagus officinalis TaxID=4686 RepID=A0A5P1E3H0_ASPOF|nr:translocase of chloroplast 120, chloroplastic [Asparagus officinalis]ONK57100.1 uncharacterized protein A4U43_C10F16620 [Asparagus officinalis]